MINSFRDQYSFLSNFFPVHIVMDSITYPTLENAYQASKTLDFNLRQTKFVNCTPGAAKRFWRDTAQYVVRSDWTKVNLGIMKSLLEQKFTNPELRELLLKTGDHELVEGNKHGDTFWGVCNGVGDNHLGKLLSEVRAQIWWEQDATEALHRDILKSSGG